jgi:disulfide bond formation protein DsbB
MNALKRLIHLNLRHWPLVALLSSALMLAIAHGFETFGHMMPCTLCLKAREVYWVAMAVAAVGVVLRRTKYRAAVSPWADTLLGLVFVFGTGLAVYHAGVEWHWWPGPVACASTGGGGGGVTAKDLTGILDGAPVHGPSCDKAAWVFLGLSMAGWNALVSLKLAVWSFIAAAREPRS